jgi:molecular chaperone DnaK
VTFAIDTDGVVSVEAKDLGTSKSQEIRVTVSSGLTEDEVNRLISEAEDHADSDSRQREFVELQNSADGLIYSTERTLEEFAEYVSDEEREELEAAIKTTKDVMQGSDCSQLKDAVDELSALSYKMTEKMYATLGEGSSEEV